MASVSHFSVLHFFVATCICYLLIVSVAWEAMN